MIVTLLEFYVCVNKTYIGTVEINPVTVSKRDNGDYSLPSDYFIPADDLGKFIVQESEVGLYISTFVLESYSGVKDLSNRLLTFAARKFIEKFGKD